MGLLCLPACAGDEGGDAWLPRLAGGPDFFDMPFPEDRRLDAGTLDLSAFPNPGRRAVLDNYLQTLSGAWPGFGTTSAIYVRLDAPAGAPDPDGLFDPTDPDARIALVAIDPEASDYGQRWPIEASWRLRGDRFLPPGTLAVRPVDGAPLAGGRRYALLIWDGFAGRRIAATPARDQRLAAPDAAGLRQLIAAGTLRADPRVVAIFTTQDPVEGLRRVAAAVDAMTAPVELLDWQLRAPQGSCRRIEGRARVPQWQHGVKPYTTEGGIWRFAADGTPVQAGTDDLGFVWWVPAMPMPSAGWPTVLSAHGTGGSRWSGGSLAADFCARGLAVFGFDQPLHGIRLPADARGDPTILTFNIFNMRATRDNIRQGAADLLALSVWLRTFDVPASPLGERLAVDPDKLLLMGHSQGASTGLPYLAVRGGRHPAAVLSGASGGLALALLYKTAPLDIPVLLEWGIGAFGELDPFHPVLNLLQAFAEASDAVNYGAFVQSPTVGAPEGGPLHLLMTEGVTDDFTPPRLFEALAATIELDWVGPEVAPVPAFGRLGRSPQPRPFGGNLTRNGQAWTSVMIQAPGGHFVVYDDPEVRADVLDFLAAAAAGETPVLETRD